MSYSHQDYAYATAPRFAQDFANLVDLQSQVGDGQRYPQQPFSVQHQGAEYPIHNAHDGRAAFESVLSRCEDQEALPSTSMTTLHNYASHYGQDPTCPTLAVLAAIQSKGSSTKTYAFSGTGMHNRHAADHWEHSKAARRMEKAQALGSYAENFTPVPGCTNPMGNCAEAQTFQHRGEGRNESWATNVKKSKGGHIESMSMCSNCAEMARRMETQSSHIRDVYERPKDGQIDAMEYMRSMTRR